MALTATASQGFELVGYTTGSEILYVPGDPGDTYTKGDVVNKTVGESHVDPAADSEAIVGSVAKTTVCPAATQGMASPAAFDPVAGAAADLCLIPVIPNVVAGTPIYEVTFAGHGDDTVISASQNGATSYLALTTGCGADDRPNGAMVYIYSATGAGQLNMADDYDHTGGAAELLLQTFRQWSTAPAANSLVIILFGEAAGSRGIGFFDRIDIQDQNNLHAADGANDGDWVVYMTWGTAGGLLQNLKLRVIPAGAVYAN